MNKLLRISRRNQHYYRYIPFGIVSIYFILLLYSEIVLGSYKIIGHYFALAPAPYFIDLEVYLCIADTAREGLSPYMAKCIEGTFNYPGTSWTLFSVLPFWTMSNLIIIGLCLALFFFISLYIFIGKINLLETIIYSLLFVSPAVMLGVERGNGDVIIFLILLVSLLSEKSKLIFSLLLFFTCMLKLYPIGASIAILNAKAGKMRESIFICAGLFISFFIYILIYQDEIRTVSALAPRPFGWYAYGLGEIPLAVKKYLNINSNFSYTIIYILFFLITSFFYYKLIYKITNIPEVKADRNGVAYLIGSGIFLVTCIIGFNYEYRLIFLLFTIPQLFKWFYSRNVLAMITLLLSVIISWQSFVTFALFSLHLGSLHYEFTLSQLFVVFLFYSHLSIACRFLYSLYTQYRLR